MISDNFLASVKAFQQNDYAAAAEQATQAAAAHPADKLYEHAATYLAQVAQAGTHDMYASPEGFTAFVRGGGNVPLYANLSDQLRTIYATQSNLKLLDIGVGDGLALLPALTELVQHVTLVEPAAAMLASTAAALTERQVAHAAFNQPVAAFMADNEGAYDIVQSTFTLQNLAPAERHLAFKWLREKSEQVLIAEFDVQMDVVAGSAEHITYLATRYRQGLAEYVPDETLVAQGFLMPILFRNFETLGEAAIYEQPIAAWEDELAAAGFVNVSRQLIHRYWWADAYLLTAQSN